MGMSVFLWTRCDSSCFVCQHHQMLLVSMYCCVAHLLLVAHASETRFPFNALHTFCICHVPAWLQLMLMDGHLVHTKHVYAEEALPLSPALAELC